MYAQKHQQHFLGVFTALVCYAKHAHCLTTGHAVNEPKEKCSNDMFRDENGAGRRCSQTFHHDQGIVRRRDAHGRFSYVYIYIYSSTSYLPHSVRCAPATCIWVEL